MEITILKKAYNSILFSFSLYKTNKITHPWHNSEALAVLNLENVVNNFGDRKIF
jgi:hypothetical protein